MNYDQIRQNNFKYFEGSPNAAAQIEAVKYIAQLASQSATSISGWDLPAIFETAPGEMATERQEINRRFFERKQETDTVMSGSLSQAQCLAIEKQGAKFKRNDETSVLKQHIEAHETDISRYSEHVKSLIRTRDEYQKRLDELLAQPQPEAIKWVERVKQVIDDGFWSFAYARNDLVHGEEYENGIFFRGITFETRNDVVIHYVKPEQGIDINVNLGKFRVSWNPGETSVYITHSGNNVWVSSRCHPHIGGHAICLGAAKPAVVGALKKGDIQAAFRLIAFILTQYNPNDAYIDLVRLHAKRLGMRDPYEASANRESVEFQEALYSILVADGSIGRVTAGTPPVTSRPPQENGIARCVTEVDETMVRLAIEYVADTSTDAAVEENEEGYF